MRLFSHWNWFTVECICPPKFLKDSFKILSLKQMCLYSLWYPSHFSQHTGSPSRLSLEVPFVRWIEMNLREISKSKGWRIKKAQHKRSVPDKTQKQCWKTNHFMSSSLIQVKFMWHVLRSLWRSKIFKIFEIEFVHA